VIAVDTSVVVAAFASWHERHERARAVVDRRPSLIAHCALESYSVLTRMPPPHRVRGDVVAEFLAERFSSRWLVMSPSDHARMLAALPGRQIRGGAAYDALVAATALAARATLATCDVRAQRVYEALGANYELID
jgi:predicted nucleic acid-binding protein